MFFPAPILIAFFLFPQFPSDAFCSEEAFRIGFSLNTLGDVNQNDALAAVQLWTSGLANENNIPVSTEPVIISSLAEIKMALQDKLIDCINATTPEYVEIKNEIDTNYLIAGIKQNSIFEEYVVLTRKSDGYTAIEDLQNKSIIRLNTSRTSLASIWLETELYERKFSHLNLFFKKVDTVNNLTAAVLPVFFHKADASLVTRSGFETMAELNPQLSQQLEILLHSKPYIPMLFAFRANYNPSFKDQLVEQLENWHNSPGGRQILTIFQTDSIVKLDPSQLHESLELVKQHSKFIQ